MMKWIFGVMIIVSVAVSLFNGNVEEVSNSALEEGVNAIELSIYMIGGMCVWGGIMRIADKAGASSALAKLFNPLAKFLFKGINLNGKAFKAMTMNITANLLGLGNAATPFGIQAMRELEIEEKTGSVASNNMILFTVLNTASITLVPTTVATLRLKHGSDNPLDVLPAILLNSLISVTVACLLTLMLNKLPVKSKK